MDTGDPIQDGAPKPTGGKGKKKKKEVKKMSLDEFLKTDNDSGKSQNWAVLSENPEDEYETRFKFDRSTLPSAPKAALGPNVDLSLIPKDGPFSVHIGNLSYDASEDDLYNFFAKLEIDNLRIITDNGRPRGYAYVDFRTRESLLEALTYHDKEYMGRTIRVDLASSDKNQDSRGGFRSNEPDRTEGDWRRRDPPTDNGSFADRDRGGRYGDRDGGFGRDRDRGFGDRDRDRGFGDRDRDRGFGDRDRGFGGDRDRGFGGDRDRGFGGDRDRGFGGDRDRGFGGDRDRGFGGDRDRGFGGDRDRGFGGDRDRGFGGDRDRGFGGDRDRGFGGDRDRGFGGDRDRGFGGDRDRGFGDRDRGYDRDRGGYGDRDHYRDRGYGDQDRGYNDRNARSNRGYGFNRDRDDGRYGSRGYDNDRYGRRDDYGRQGRRDDDFDRRPSSRDGSQESREAPKTRPVLNLKPRSIPKSADNDNQPATRSSIFGAAKPVDTYAKEKEIEEKLQKESFSSGRGDGGDRDRFRRQSGGDDRDRWQSSGEDRDRRQSGGEDRDRRQSGGEDRDRRQSGGEGSAPGGRSRNEEDSIPSEEGRAPTSPKTTESPAPKMVPAPPPKENAWAKKKEPEAQVSPPQAEQNVSNNATTPASRKDVGPPKSPWGGNQKEHGPPRSDGPRGQDRKPLPKSLRDDRDRAPQKSRPVKERPVPKSIEDMPKYEETRAKDFSDQNKFAFLLEDGDNHDDDGDQQNSSPRYEESANVDS